MSGNNLDSESVTHVSNSFSTSGNSETSYNGGITPSDNVLNDIMRNLTPYYHIDVTTLIVEEENFNLEPPEVEAYKAKNWTNACE